ncbi:MAG: hypothetical protein AB7P03_28215 [Kofleriaceae bacterium]
MAVTASLMLGACSGDVPDLPDGEDSGLFDDFVGDGKYDESGHPLNSRVTDAAEICSSTTVAGTLGVMCEGELEGSDQNNTLVVNARLRASSDLVAGELVRLTVLKAGQAVRSVSLDAAALRGHWQHLSVEISNREHPQPLQVRLELIASASVEVEYFEVFPKVFGIVMAPGSGVYTDDQELSIELAPGKPLLLQADGVDISSTLDALLASNIARQELTSFRRIVHVPIGMLLPDRPDVVELRALSNTLAARVQIRRTEPACLYEGSGARKVLVTGFQPFPANGRHDNVSGVAVSAMDPTRVIGAQVMRLVLPVEFNAAAAEVVSAIDRCQPDVIVSFGQGNWQLKLEQTAYNLKDTSEVAGGVPDNRGVISLADKITEGGSAERSTLLDLDAIETALRGVGEAPVRSIDPGRYVCNNVFYEAVGRSLATGKRAGFIHLPYTTTFPDATRARFARAVEAAVTAAARP